MRRSLVVLATVAAVLMVSATAMAAKPEVVGEGDFVDGWFFPAGAECAFEVRGHSVGSFRETEFYNNDGSLRKFTVHVKATSYWSSDYGEAVERWSWNGTLDPAANTFTTNGNVWNVHAGAGGVRVNDKGRIVFDNATGEAITINGPHEAFEDGIGGVCDALAP